MGGCFQASLLWSLFVFILDFVPSLPCSAYYYQARVRKSWVSVLSEVDIK